MNQLLWGIGQCTAQGCDPWEKGSIKWVPCQPWLFAWGHFLHCSTGHWSLNREQKTHWIESTGTVTHGCRGGWNFQGRELQRSTSCAKKELQKSIYKGPLSLWPSTRLCISKARLHKTRPKISWGRRVCGWAVSWVDIPEVTSDRRCWSSGQAEWKNFVEHTWHPVDNSEKLAIGIALP